MPNTFGNGVTQVELVDPRDIRMARRRFGRDAITELEFANGLYIPVNNPARGWILLARADYDLVRGYGRNYTLSLADPYSGTALSFSNLAIVQARSVTTGLVGDANAVYLVELTDARGVLSNRFFRFPINAYYNVLSPGYPANYYASSLNGSSAWTWSTMIGDVWAKLGVLGTYPGLPLTPSGTPTNWSLPGVSAWDALIAMLTHVGLGVSCDLTSTTPYGIVSMGASDAAFDALTVKWATNLQDDLDWIDVGAGRVPGTVIVYFRRVNQYYGTEETVRRDSLQWATNSVYSVPIAAPAFFAGAIGTHSLYDDFAIRYDANGNPLAADMATAQAIAAERVSQYFDVIYSATSGCMDRTYAGVLPFYAGSQVDGVCFRQDFRDNSREGWRTQVRRGGLWEVVY